MKINTHYESAAFKSCGHTVIIVKTALPDPMGDSPACERIREFYRELNKIYFYMTEDDLKKRILLECFGVEVIDLYSIKDRNYEKKYYKALEMIENS